MMFLNILSLLIFLNNPTVALGTSSINAVQSNQASNQEAPLMIKANLAGAIRDLKSTTTEKSPEHCSPAPGQKKTPASAFDTILTNNQKEESFNAQINCQLKCKNSPRTIKDFVSANFSTKDQGLVRGDGNLWAPLGMAIQGWASEHCLALATKYCNKIENIEEFKVNELESGKWSMPGVLTCQENTPTFSPLDKKTQSLPRKVDQPGKAKVETFFNWRNINLSKRFSTQPLPEIPIKNCQNNLKVTFCAGDCLINENNLKITLATPNPTFKTDLYLCGDGLKKIFEGKNYSKEVIDHYCKSFIRSQLIKFLPIGITCSASRFDSNCHQFAKQIN